MALAVFVGILSAGFGLPDSEGDADDNAEEVVDVPGQAVHTLVAGFGLPDKEFTLESKKKSFAKMLSDLNEKLYKKRFFNPEHNEKMFETVKQMVNTYDDVCKPPLVVVMKNREPVKEAVTQRVPVFFGKPINNLYDENILNKMFGYSTEKAMLVKRDNPFCIAGTVRILNDSPSFWGCISVVHGWALNFENKITDDYTRFVKDNNMKFAECKTELRARAFLWIRSALELHPDGCTLRMPAVGLGAFLTAVQREKEKLVQMTFDVLNEVQKENQSVKLILYDFDHVFANYLSHKNLCFKIIDGGNIFDINGVKRALAKETLCQDELPLVLLNAWDPVSFVGNGGWNDLTIDGMLVAGCGANIHLKNTSFLHNPAFHPSMGDSTTWVRVQV
jgi:hypothetical protein